MEKSILLVENSALVRRYIVTLLQKEGYCVESVKNREELQTRLRSQRRYSLVIIDIEMPEGIELVAITLKYRANRVLILHSDTQHDLAMQALELGAIDTLLKPKNSVDIAHIASELLQKIRNVLLIFPQKREAKEPQFIDYDTNIDTDIGMGFVLIGASTGGPRLIEKICKTLPQNYPHAVCVVQHMPTDFTSNFARRLNTVSKVEVLEADNTLELKRARVIIAKGGKHLHFRKKLNKFFTVLVPNTKERFFTPSVDEMFFSAAEVLPVKDILAVELTGIGDDGADGMVELRKKGAYTIAESEESAVVYGMPKEAAVRGGASKVLPFNEILDEIIKYGQAHATHRTRA